jgi:HD-like signal output (HDOD) protein
MFKKRVLIADANAESVAGFRQALGEQWELSTAATGRTAIEEMDKQPADVVVADIDLPEMDGAELLGKIRSKYPKTVLFILANEAEKERVMKSALGAHQFLTKPCDKATLKKAIDRALALDVWIASNRMRELVARVRSFPTVPSLYLEILAALRSPNTTTEQIGGIIAKDMAMMTKLLQVLNSAYFGLPRKITDPVEAVGILGFEAVKSMVMTLKLLSQYDQLKPIYFSIDRLWRHSTEVGRAARQLTLIETGDRALAETAFTAGLMHDLGKVVLASNFDEQYSGAQSLARKQQLVMWEVEKEIFGASHAEIGAYLLGLWGMPLDLLEASALHHQPLSTITKGFTPLTAVHAANVLVHELNPEREGAVPSKLDEAYLAEIGLLERLPTWREAVANLEAGKADAKPKPAEAAAPRAAAKPAPKPVRSAPAKPASQPAAPVSAGGQSGGVDGSFQS